MKLHVTIKFCPNYIKVLTHVYVIFVCFEYCFRHHHYYNFYCLWRYLIFIHAWHTVGVLCVYVCDNIVTYITFFSGLPSWEERRNGNERKKEKKEAMMKIKLF